MGESDHIFIYKSHKKLKLLTAVSTLSRIRFSKSSSNSFSRSETACFDNTGSADTSFEESFFSSSAIESGTTDSFFDCARRKGNSKFKIIQMPNL